MTNPQLMRCKRCTQIYRLNLIGVIKIPVNDSFCRTKMCPFCVWSRQKWDAIFGFYSIRKFTINFWVEYTGVHKCANNIQTELIAYVSIVYRMILRYRVRCNNRLMKIQQWNGQIKIVPHRILNIQNEGKMVAQKKKQKNERKTENQKKNQTKKKLIVIVGCGISFSSHSLYLSGHFMRLISHLLCI